MIYLTSNFIKVQTANLLILDVTPYDWDDVKNFFEQNPDALEYSAWQDLYSRGETSVLFEDALRYQFDKPRQNFILKISTQADPRKIIGICSLCLTNIKEKMLNAPEQSGIARFFLARHAQGLFYSLEVLDFILRLGFIHLSLHRISMYVDHRNDVLRKLLQRGNLREEGICREFLFYGGEWVDQYIYSILKDEWTKLKNG